MSDIAVGAAQAPEAFFEEVRRASQLAIASAGSSEHYYRIGDFVLRLCFAGQALVPQLTPALQHLAVPPAAPDLTVFLWDSVSTGVQMPPPPWTEDDYVVRAEITGYNNERIHTAYDVWGGGLRLLDQQQNLGLFWIRDADTLPSYERGAPLRMILNWWLRQRGLQFVHAAAVGTERGGVLLAGKGGSGKSTTSLVCLRAGLLYASDDYCLLDARSAPCVHSLYNSAKLEPHHQGRLLPELTPHISNHHELDSEKALFFMAEHYREQVSRGFPIKAILLPTVSGGADTSLQPASAVAALKALAPSTIFQLSGAGQLEFRSMATLVRQVPCYSLRLGTDLEQIPRLIRELLAGDEPAALSGHCP